MGGAEQIVAELTDRLIMRGHQVDICVFNGDNISVTFDTLSSEWKGYKPQLFVMGNSYYNPFYIFKLRRLIKQYDIVHTHNSSPQLYAAIANIGIGKHLITTEHNTDNRKRGSIVLSFIDKLMYKRYEKIVCISDIAECRLREYLKASHDGVFTIPNGVDVYKIRKSNSLLKDKTADRPFIVLMVAAFRPQKDQDTLVRAIAKLGDGYEVWFAGNGERQEHVSCLAKQILVGNIKFLGVRKDIPELLHTADVIVMSSHYEGLSLSSIEGMSAGRPFVASDVNGLREVTKGYGLLFPEGDAGALADIIKKLHDDKTLRQSVADKCWERAQLFDVNKMVDSYEQHYKLLMH